MMKKNKLYTINKRRAEIINRPVFMPKEENLFAGTFGSSQMLNYNLQPPTALTQPKVNWSNPVQRAAALGTTKGMVENFGKDAAANNAFNAVDNGASGLTNFFSENSDGLLSFAGNTVGGIGYGLLSNGLSSGAGSAINSLGSTVGGIVGKANPLLGGIITAGAGIIGGGINALFGQSVDEEALKQANEGTAAYNNFTSNAGTFDKIKGPEAQANVRDVYKDGLFGGDADEKNEALKEARRDARQWAGRSVNNNIFNLQQDQVNNAMRNFKAFGGLTRPKKHKFDDGGYMTQEEAAKVVDNSWEANTLFNDAIPWTMKQDTIFGKEGFNAMYGDLLNGNSPALLSLGGDLQTHGADYSVGKIYDVSEKEANRLKAMGYEFTVVG